MGYLTYSEYQAMGGTLPEASFNDFAYEAESKIDWYTFNRLQKETVISEKVKRCEYHLIQLLQSKAEALGSGAEGAGGGGYEAAVASRSNDGVSESYNILSAKDVVDQTDKEIEKTIKQYLSGAVNSLGYNLLYRGLYPYE